MNLKRPKIPLGMIVRHKGETSPRPSITVTLGHGVVWISLRDCDASLFQYIQLSLVPQKPIHRLQFFNPVRQIFWQYMRTSITNSRRHWALNNTGKRQRMRMSPTPCACLCEYNSICVRGEASAFLRRLTAAVAECYGHQICGQRDQV